MSDLVDRASTVEQMQRDDALKRHKNRSQPVFSSDPRQCMECDKTIPDARIRAVPSATLCIDCQSIAEQRQKHRRQY